MDGKRMETSFSVHGHILTGKDGVGCQKLVRILKERRISRMGTAAESGASRATNRQLQPQPVRYTLRTKHHAVFSHALSQRLVRINCKFRHRRRREN